MRGGVRTPRLERMIEVRNLQKKYGGKTAVADVSFTVGEGEIFGVLGPNGAGKTTTVESIAGLRIGDGGSVRVAGLDPWTDRAGVTSILGVQLQESQLQPKITSAEAVALYASFYDSPADGDELLARLGMREHAHRRYEHLSGGQQQRLAIALALVGRPRVVVLDELTTGLDPRARRDVWALVEDVRDSGVTVVLVTHSMEEAERLCDRLAIIDRGRVVALGSAHDLAGGGSDPSPQGSVVIRFVPSSGVADAALRQLSGVTGVRREDGTVVVTGDDHTTLEVLDHLREYGVRPHRLRITEPRPRHATLDEAYLQLTDTEETR